MPLIVGFELFEKDINNHLTTVYYPIMNTLVHIVRFCVRESVAHTQKVHKVQPCLNAKIGMYIIGL